MKLDSVTYTRWSATNLDHLNLSPDSKRFLCVTGLPNVKALPLKYITDGTLIESNLVLADTYGNKTLLIAGSEWIMMEQSSPLGRSELRGSDKMLFVNSSIMQFHDSLCLFEILATDPRIQSEDIDYINVKTVNFKRDLAIIDQEATKRDSAWGKVLEEMSWPI